MTAALIIVAWWCLLIVAWSLCRAAARGDRYLPPEAPVDPSLPSEGRPAPVLVLDSYRPCAYPDGSRDDKSRALDVIADAAAAPGGPDAAA